MTPKWHEVLAWRNKRDRQAADEEQWMAIKRFQPNSKCKTHSNLIRVISRSRDIFFIIIPMNSQKPFYFRMTNASSVDRKHKNTIDLI